MKDNETYVIHHDSPFGNTTYGIIHVAKTGGTSLNGVLARKYERICANKGSSYQKYKWESRARIGSYTKMKEEMDSVGYEDCDVIMVEKPWEFWKERFEDWFFPVELHVPCRDPLEQIMSMCNMHKVAFECPSMNLSDKAFNKRLMESLGECRMGFSRVAMELQEVTNFDLKCFDFQYEFTKYLDYMDTRLQRKRIETIHTFRNGFAPRNRSHECVKEDNAFQDRVKRFMIDLFPHDYYRFCDLCLGSQYDLFAMQECIGNESVPYERHRNCT